MEIFWTAFARSVGRKNILCITARVLPTNSVLSRHSWILRRWSLLVGMELTAFAHMTPGAYVRSRTGIVPTLNHVDVVTYVRQITANNDPNPFERPWGQQKSKTAQKKAASAAAVASTGGSHPIVGSQPILPLPTDPTSSPATVVKSSSKHVSRYPQSAAPSPSVSMPKQSERPLTLKPIGSSKGSNVFKDFLGPSHRPERSPCPAGTSEALESHPREWGTPDRPPFKQRLVNPQRVTSNVTRSFPADTASFVAPIAIKQRSPTPPSATSPFIRTFLPHAGPPSAEAAFDQISSVGSDAVAAGTISKQQFDLGVAMLKGVSPTQRCFLWNSHAASLAFFKNPITLCEQRGSTGALGSTVTSSSTSASSSAVSSSSNSSSSTTSAASSSTSTSSASSSSSSSSHFVASPSPKLSQPERTVPTAAAYCQMDYNARRKVWLEAPQPQLQILWDSLPPKAEASSRHWAERVGIAVSKSLQTSSSSDNPAVDDAAATAVDVDSEVL